MQTIQITNKNIKDSIETLNTSSSQIQDLKMYFNKIKDSSGQSVEITGLKNLDSWYFDENNNFSHKSGKFFKVSSIYYKNIISGILIQPDIGTLGLISTFIDGVLHFLIQFKGEPGSIDFFQLSPTVQATKSNYSKVHKGNKPPYWEEFKQLSQQNIIEEAVLSEQGTRYFQKFNRNVILYSEKILPELDNFKWMTLGQIYDFHNTDNSINSCLRSVLSILNPEKEDNKNLLRNYNLHYLLNKNKGDSKVESRTQDGIENFYDKKKDSVVFNTDLDNFSVLGIKVNLKGREVSSWHQPIVLEDKSFKYYLFRVFINNNINYMWRITEEPGYSFGFMYGPSIMETSYMKNNNDLEEIINKFKEVGTVTQNKTFRMSEEGGRFWRSTADHYIYDVNLKDKDMIPKEYTVFDNSETYDLLEKGFLSIEARSLLYFSNSIKKAE